MATPVVANVVKSGAAIWYAPVGEAIPDETSVAYGAAWGGNWARVGYTKEPMLWLYEDERHRAEVEEEITAVREWRIHEDTSFETVLSELTAAYFELSRGGDPSSVSTTAAGAGQTGYEELKVGGEVVMNEFAWGFEGMYLNASGVSFPIRVFIHKGTAKLNGELSFSRKDDDYTGIPIQIHALVDTTKSAGEKLFTFQRVTTAATS